MLIRTSELKNFQLLATDGDIGRARDFLFDDEKWTIRYMVANTGKWLLGQKVLISPGFLKSPDLSDERMPLSISKDQVEHAPPIEEDQPVSRQYEQVYADYFKHGYYWVGGSVWGVGHTPYDIATPEETTQTTTEADDDEHLRSAEEVTGYRVYAGKEHVGYVDDFVLDTANWTVLLIGIDTHKWLPGKSFMLPVAWASDISWTDRSLTIDVDEEQLKSAPEFGDDQIAVKDVARLYKHFGRSQA